MESVELFVEALYLYRYIDKREEQMGKRVDKILLYHQIESEVEFYSNRNNRHIDYYQSQRKTTRISLIEVQMYRNCF